MQTWLVTGGAGFIGSNFVRAQVRSGRKIITLDALTYAGRRENLSALDNQPNHLFVECDIADSALVAKLLAEHQPHALIHFAAESHVDRSITGPSAFIHTNILGTFKLLEAARHYHASLSTHAQAAFRFLHVSTDEVFGSLTPNAPAFSEASNYAPNSPYSASKAASDHLARSYFHTYGLPVLTTHCSNNYGPYQYPEKLIPLCISRALSGKPLPIYGDGKQIRDWLYVEDHCRALARVLEAAPAGENYCIGGNCERTNLEIVHTLCAALDAKCPRADGKSYAEQIAFVADRAGHDRRYAINAEKIKNTLGWQPAENFDTGIARTVDWYLENRAWWESAA